MIIDYANSPHKSDFLDVYLGANCSSVFTSTGFDAIPYVFRRPIAYVTVPIKYFFTFSRNFLIIAKHHFSKNLNKKLSFSEIVDLGVIDCVYSADFEKNISLIENSPDEIEELCNEMMDRIENKWIENKDNVEIQKNSGTIIKINF